MMTKVTSGLLGGIVFLLGFSPAPLRAQACEAEDAMISDYRQSLTDLIETVRKESLEEFQRAYRQKTCLTRLSLFVTVIDPVVECLDEAAAAPEMPKKQAAAIKDKRDSYVKLKTKLEEYRDALKKAQEGKEAKALIEKINLGE